MFAPPVKAPEGAATAVDETFTLENEVALIVGETESAVPLAGTQTEETPVDMAILTDDEEEDLWLELMLDELLDEEVGATEETTMDLTTVLTMRVVE